MSVDVMFVYLPPRQGTHAGELVAPASGVPLWCVPRAVTSTDEALVEVSSSKTISSAATASAPSSEVAESPHLRTAAVHAVDGVSSTAAVSDVAFPVASRAKGHFGDVREDSILKVPVDSLCASQRMNVSITKTVSSSSTSLLPSNMSRAASLHTGASHTSITVPATFLMLQLPTETLDFFLPSELQTQLQIALTTAGVHVSPYALQCLRRHVLRSQLASLRHFTPPLLPPVLLRSADSPCMSHKPEVRAIDGGRCCPVREQRFCVAPEVVVHLVFQSWKNYLFLPVDAAAAAVMGLIPSSPEDAVAAAALAAWGCVAAKRRHVSSMRQAPASRGQEGYGLSAVSALGFTPSAAAAANRFQRNVSVKIHDRVEVPVAADAFPGRDTARTPARDAKSAAGTVTSPELVPAALLSRPLPLFLCAQEAALRALAYWSCLAELQELALQHHYVSADELGMQEWQRGSSTNEIEYSGRPFAASSYDISSIRLVQQLKQSFHSVMKTVLKRQRDALGQLRERQSREMEEVSGRKEFTSVAPAAVMPDGDIPQVMSSMSERIPTDVPSSPLLPADAAPPVVRNAALHTGAAVAAPAAGRAEVAAGAATSAAACATISALRNDIIADEESSTVGEKSPQLSADRSIETSSVLAKNRCKADVAPDTNAAKREIDNARSEGLVDTGQSPVLEGMSMEEAVHIHAEAQNPTRPLVTLPEKPGSGSRRLTEDTKTSRHCRDEDATGREKVEALVLQHVSEFQLVEMHWQAESLLLRRQQLQNLKNITVDLVLLRRAARQGYLASPLVLPPLPSAFEGEVVQLLPKEAPSMSLQISSWVVDTPGTDKLSALTCTDSEGQEQGKNPPPGVRTRFGNLQRVFGEKKVDSEEKVEMSISPHNPSQSDAAQLEKSAVNPVLTSSANAEAQEVQRLLRMYLPACRGHNKGGTASAETETAMRNQQQTQGSRSGIGGQTCTIDAAPLSSPVAPRKYFTQGDLQERPVIFTESEREVPSVQQKMWHPSAPRSLREPLPAALQIVTPTKLLRCFSHHQQHRRQTADERGQLQTSVPQGGRQTFGSEAYHLEKGYEGRRPPYDGATDLPRNSGSSFVHRSTCTVSEEAGFPKGTETTRTLTGKVKYCDLTQLEAWEDTVKRWPEEHAVKQLQHHAFLPLIFGKQRKRSAIIRICSGNITDVAACDPEYNGTCQNNYYDSGFHISSGGRFIGARRMSATGTFKGLLTAKSVGDVCHAQYTWEEYDYCSDLASSPACSDKLFSDVRMFFQSEPCSDCTALPRNLNRGGKQLNKLCPPVHSPKRQTLAGTVGASATRAATHGTEKYRFLASQVTTFTSQTVDNDAGTGICQLHTRPVADRTGVGVAAAPGGDSLRCEQFAKNWFVTSGCSSLCADTAPERWKCRETPYVSQSERSHSRCFSFPAPMLAPSGVDLELGALGIVLSVGSSLKLAAPSHLRWKSHVSDTTDFVFPSLDEQRQMLYRTLLQDQHYGMLLHARIRGEFDAWRKRGGVCEETVREASRIGSCREYDTSSADNCSVHSLSPLYRCAPAHCAPRLHLGDVFISRHSNSGPVNAVFHLVVHEEKDPDEVIVRGEQPGSPAVPIKARGKEAIPLSVLQGVGEVLKISSTEGLRTLVLPLLLLEGEAAICSLTYAQLQQRAFQVVRYVINEIKDIYQNSSDVPNLRQIVLVLPPMPMNTAAARRIPLTRASSKCGTADIDCRSMTVTLSEKVQHHVDSVTMDSAGSVRCTGSGTINGSVSAPQQHPTAALRKEPLPVNSWMEGVLNLVISYVRNCGHCWVGKEKPRSHYHVPHT